MGQAGNNNNVNSQKPRKLTLKGLIILLFFTFAVGAILFCFFIFKKDYEEMAENSATYSGNAMISATDGIVSYVKDEDGNYVTDENGNYIPLTAGDVLEHINSISTYLEDDSEFTKEEKLEYLLNAGLVTKFPYIEGLAEDKVNGIVKFYRYSETEQAEDPEQEKYLLKFVDEETFEQAMEAYETSGSNEVFKYFTIDEEQQLVIACMSETQKEVTTNDPEVTVDIIKKTSADIYTGNNGKYNAGQKTITKQTKDYQSIIEQYTMPFNLLAAFLVQTGDYDFVKELADMAYESEIHIGIYENTSITTKSDTYTYKKRIEYTPNTVLDFSKLSTTNPVVKEDDVNRKIIKSCIANMAENAESQILQITHEMTNMGGEPAGSVDPAEVYTKYVQSYSGSQISELSSEGANFETKYWTRTESRTSLTIGTILADTWVARWEAKYNAEPNEPTPGPTSSPPPDSERTVIQDGTSLFIGSAETEVSGKLNEHSENLKNNAVNSIIATTHVSVATPKMTAEMIRNQGYTCDKCEEELDNAFPGLPGEENSNPWRDSSKLSDNDLVARVKNQENLSHTRQHINSKLQNQSDQKLEKAQADFEKELKDEIGYIQYPTVAKSYVSINVEPYYEKTSVTHKQQTPERTEDGEKFKALFNNSEFHESKRAILDRIQWFWEYIREYDDTAKFENILRYLLNIATDSNQFGDFSEEDIENLFKAFEPKELQNVASMGHLQAFAEWLKSYENEDLRKYMNGEGSYVGDAVKSVTEDKQFGKMYYTEHDGCLNYTYGIVVRFKNGTTNNKSYFEKYGYDVDELLREYDSGGEALVSMEDLEKIKLDLIKDKYKSVKSSIENYKDNGVELGVTMEEYQYYALTSVTYQYGNCGQGIQGPNNPAALYKKYYLEEENPEGFRQNAVSKDGHGNLVHYFTGSNYEKRKENTWILFNEGRYILNNGEEIYASGAGTVAEFAQQFEGLTASDIKTEGDHEGGLFYYKASDGTSLGGSAEWCAMFVTYCFDKCNILDTISGGYTSCSIKVNSLQNEGKELKTVADGYIPQSGDVVFWYTPNGTYPWPHTGIVHSSNGTTVKIIEGNTGDSDNNLSKVSIKEYNIDGSGARGKTPCEFYYYTPGT